MSGVSERHQGGNTGEAAARILSLEALLAAVASALGPF